MDEEYLVERSRTKAYLRLNGKYLKEAEALLRRGDYTQASEKLWGACAEIVKAVAAKRGISLGTHRSVGEYVDKLHRDHPDWKLREAFAYANSLHTNFYEDWLTEDFILEAATRIRDFVAKLRSLV